MLVPPIPADQLAALLQMQRRVPPVAFDPGFRICKIRKES
jgi:hypothetical protein